MIKLIVTDVDGTLLDNNSIRNIFDITLSCVKISFLNLKYNYFIIKY